MPQLTALRECRGDGTVLVETEPTPCIDNMEMRAERTRQLEFIGYNTGEEEVVQSGGR